MALSFSTVAGVALTKAAARSYFALASGSSGKGGVMAAKSGDARKAVDAIDLDRIVRQVAAKHRWTPERTREAELWYRNFLYLRSQHPEPVAMIVKDADTVWHAHILHTRKYADDCDRVFGELLHHEPVDQSLSAEELEQHRGRAAELYRQASGKLPRQLQIICV